MWWAYEWRAMLERRKMMRAGRERESGRMTKPRPLHRGKAGYE